MKLILIFVISVLYINDGYTKTSDKDSTRKPSQAYQINTFDPHFPIEYIDKDVYQVNPEEQQEAPTKKAQIKILKNSNLEQETKSWDELEKDILILRAANSTIDNLTKNYPNISPQKLATLKNLVRNKK